MLSIRSIFALTLTVLIIACAHVPTSAHETTAITSTKTVVLVHGAFADGSSWNKIIPILRANDLDVIAVQNPLTSLADDVAFTNRAIRNAKGSVILVGHSWGGAVITEAGNHEKVEALVYLSAFAPSAGEHIHDVLNNAHGVRKIPTVPGFANPVVDKDGFLGLSEADIVKYFAPDIPEADARLIAAGQGWLHGAALDQVVTKAAWKEKPSWFIVSTNDQMIAPDVLRLEAAKIGAIKVELPTSHVGMLSEPEGVARVILDAAMVP